MVPGRSARLLKSGMGSVRSPMPANAATLLANGISLSPFHTKSSKAAAASNSFISASVPNSRSPVSRSQPLSTRVCSRSICVSPSPPATKFPASPRMSNGAGVPPYSSSSIRFSRKAPSMIFTRMAARDPAAARFPFACTISRKSRFPRS